MRGGHNRVPDAVKKARGTARKDRMRADAPALDPTKVPAPPRGLTKDERELWVELAQQVDALGTYTPACLTAFRLMVTTNAAARYPDPRDPATARVRVAQVASGLLQRFGLDPASSGRVSGRKPEEKADPTAALLFGGGPPELKVVPGGGT